MNHKSFLGSAGLMIGILVTLLLAPGAGATGKYKTLYKFKSGKDGSEPFAGVIFDRAGNLYGTTSSGGKFRSGTAFQLSPNKDGTWSKKSLFSFFSKGGVAPADLILDRTGSLYGTTASGGNTNSGALFQLTPNGDGSWKESVLHSFDNDGGGGYGPNGDVILDQAGNIYGTTVRGGKTLDSDQGTVFRVSWNGFYWTESVLYSFEGGKDGSFPSAGVIFDSAGNLYGTTDGGGDYGYGTVFKLSPNGDGTWTESVLHSFNFDSQDGSRPYGGLFIGPQGNLYGTTYSGGANGCDGNGCGVVFQLVPSQDGSWTESVLHSFNDDDKDGYFPAAGLILDRAGNLCGSTSEGGSYGYGAVFKLRPTARGGWNEIVLHSFRNHPGSHPYGGLILGPQGNIYGTTAGDGFATFGSVFEIMP